MQGYWAKVFLYQIHENYAIGVSVSPHGNISYILAYNGKLIDLNINIDKKIVLEVVR